jgi:hypothetical protein
MGSRLQKLERFPMDYEWYVVPIGFSADPAGVYCLVSGMLYHCHILRN